MMKTTFETTILGFGNNAGIEVPAENIAELGTSKKPPVTVTVGSYVYKSTVAVMGGKFMISLSKAHRDGSGLKAGDTVTVELVLDEGPREVETPEALTTALESAGLTAAFEALSYSKRKEFCRQVAEAKSEDTRTRRVEKVLGEIQASE